MKFLIGTVSTIFLVKSELIWFNFLQSIANSVHIEFIERINYMLHSRTHWHVDVQKDSWTATTINKYFLFSIFLWWKYRTNVAGTRDDEPLNIAKTKIVKYNR